MSEAKFTKKMEVGITVDNSPFCIDGFCNVDGRRFEVCAVWGVNDDTVACAQSKANAHLIAAAPEMYAMLENSLDEIYMLVGKVNEKNAGFTNYDDMYMVREIKFLLAKVRGEHD